MNAIFRSILDAISSVVGSHGLAVILFTILIKLVLLPFDFKSRKSMRRMEKVNPQLAALQKKYANDKEKLQRKQAELYKKEKINPLGSCLPMLLTMPVLFIMFGAMRGAANERLVQSMMLLQDSVQGLTAQPDIIASLPAMSDLVEPFLWIKNLWIADSPLRPPLPVSSADLSAITGAIANVITTEQLVDLKAFLDSEVYQQIILPHYNCVPLAGGTINLIIAQMTVYQVPNGFFILPLLSGATQYLTTLLTPQQAQQTGQQGGTGAMMKWFFPIFSIWICSTSNAAFALYWVISNLVAMAQQVGFKMYFDAQDKKAALRAEEVTL